MRWIGDPNIFKRDWINLKAFKMDKNIQSLRKDIDDIDKEIIRLISKRISITKEIGTIKNKNELPIFDFDREKEIFENICNDCIKYNLDEKYINSIFHLIIDYSKETQRK